MTDSTRRGESSGEADHTTGRTGASGDTGRRRRRPRRRGARREQGADSSPPVAVRPATLGRPVVSGQATEPEARLRRRRRQRPESSPRQRDNAPSTTATAASAPPPHGGGGAATGDEAGAARARRRRRRRRPEGSQPRQSHDQARREQVPAASASKHAPEAAAAASAEPTGLTGALEFPDESDWELTPAPSPRLARRAPAREEEPEEEGGDGAEAGPPPRGPSILEMPEPDLDPDGDDESLDLDPSVEPPRGTLRNLAQVYLRDRCRLCPVEVGELDLQPGERAVVETEQGLAVAQVVRAAQRSVTEEPPRRVLRRVDANDQRQQARNLVREREAFAYCRERIKHRRLPMKLIRVEYLHGGSKAIFYFAAENRVDFRELVKDLAARLHTRIVMRQVGVRDESRMTGGIGSCGCELCCATWLPHFEPVSIRMAKDQNLVLNPQKVSGQCGRLKCCLGYEQTQYQECRKHLPKVGRRVQTPEGEGRVVDIDILRLLVRVAREDGSEQQYPASQVHPLPASSRENG